VSHRRERWVQPDVALSSTAAVRALRVAPLPHPLDQDRRRQKRLHIQQDQLFCDVHARFYANCVVQPFQQLCLVLL
jgi:hypothetical protein